MKGLKKYALTPLLSNFLARRFFTSPARSWLLLTLGPKVSTYDLKLEYTKQRKNMDNGEYYIERNETRFMRLYKFARLLFSNSDAALLL